MPKHYDDGKNAPRATDITFDQADTFAVEVVKIGAMCFTPFFRRRVGDRYYKYGIFSLAAIVMMISASPSMVVFGPLWLAFLLVGGVDKREHSLSGGWSRLGFFGQRAARFIEPLAVYTLGFGCLPFDEAFGCFVLVGATCMLMLAMYEWQQVNRWKRKMRDDREMMAHMSWMQREGY